MSGSAVSVQGARARDKPQEGVPDYCAGYSEYLRPRKRPKSNLFRKRRLYGGYPAKSMNSVVLKGFLWVPD